MRHCEVEKGVNAGPEMQKAVNAVNAFVPFFVVLIFGLCIDCTAVLSFWLYISIEQLCSCANFWAVHVNFESSYACLL